MTATVAPLARAQQRGHGAVDAAAHRHERPWPPARRRRQARATAHRGPERAGERVGGDLGGVQLAGAETAELGRDLRRADARRVEDRAAAHERHRGAAGGGRRAAAVRVEAGVGDPVAVDAQRQRDLIAARAAADGRGERVIGPPAVALGRGQVMLEGDGIHRPRG